MITFFRKIRKKLADDHKPLAYARYAVGEIVLVVIGILIALSINNWNEDRKTHLHDMGFLNNLKVELSVDIAALTSKISEYERINDDIKNTLRFFDGADHLPTTVEHQMIISALSQFQKLTPIYKNINRNDFIIAQGTIDRIDPELNRKFLTYLEDIQSINATISKLGETLQQLEVFQIHPNVDYNDINPLADRLAYDFKDIFNNRGVRNTLQKSYGYRQFYIGNMSGKIKDAESLIALIDLKMVKAGRK